MNPSSARLHHIGHLTPDASWHRVPHTHDHHELIVILAGRLHVEIGKRSHVAGPGELFWYPARLRHKEWTEAKSPVELLFIAFSWSGRADVFPRHHQMTDIRGRVGLLARWLFEDRIEKTSYLPDATEGFFHALLVEWLRLASGNTDPRVLRVRAYMRQHLAEQVTLDQLASCVGLSKFHFVRQYRLLTRCSPMEDLRHLRLLAARDLLLTTALPIKEIAPRTGLGDAYHLSRLFKQHFQTSPGSLPRPAL
jgi:AraC-like DNA-binding protein